MTTDTTTHKTTINSDLTRHKEGQNEEQDGLHISNSEKKKLDGKLLIFTLQLALQHSIKLIHCSFIVECDGHKLIIVHNSKIIYYITLFYSLICYVNIHGLFIAVEIN